MSVLLGAVAVLPDAIAVLPCTACGLKDSMVMKTDQLLTAKPETLVKSVDG